MVQYDRSYDPDDFIQRDAFEDREREERQRDRRDQEQRRDRNQEFIEQAELEREREAVREVVNNPNITLDSSMIQAVNDPKVQMQPNGRLTIRRSGQFSRQNLLPRLSAGKKKTRKKTKMDTKMSRALKKANSQLRKKNGQLRKGKSMKDVMRLAHRLAKKMR